MMIKKTILVGVVGLLISTMSCAQKGEKIAVETIIKEFAKAADNNDVKKLSSYLDDNYRIVMNRLFGSKEVSIIDKKTYLSKVESKEWGGDTRELTLESIVINGTSASAKVIMKGKKMTFVSLLTLIKNNNNEWKLVSDTPVIQ